MLFLKNNSSLIRTVLFWAVMLLIFNPVDKTISKETQLLSHNGIQLNSHSFQTSANHAESESFNTQECEKMLPPNFLWFWSMLALHNADRKDVKESRTNFVDSYEANSQNKYVSVRRKETNFYFVCSINADKFRPNENSREVFANHVPDYSNEESGLTCLAALRI